MKILHISTSDRGGAGIACIRLHKALLSKGIDSNVLILDGTNRINDKIFTYHPKGIGKLKKFFFFFQRHFLPTIHQLKLKKYNFTENFSYLSTSYRIHKHPLVQESNIIHLHYIADFIDYKSFFRHINKPIVWTLHDINPLSGGMHSPLIKQINTTLVNKLNKLENTLANKKKRILDRVNKLVIISPSKWLFELSIKSNILKNREHFHIPHFVDANIFNRKDKVICRQLLGWDLSKKIVLFIADRFSRTIKGFDYFKQICKHFQHNPNILFYSIGIDDNTNVFTNSNYLNLGYINSENYLSIIYSASDILLQTSLHESFSLTTLEAMACGLPVLAFNTTGLKELIKNDFNGKLSSIGDIRKMINDLEYIFSNDEFYSKLSQNASNFVKESYSFEKLINKFINIYEKLYLN